MHWYRFLAISLTLLWSPRAFIFLKWADIADAYQRYILRYFIIFMHRRKTRYWWTYDDLSSKRKSTGLLLMTFEEIFPRLILLWHDADIYLFLFMLATWRNNGLLSFICYFIQSLVGANTGDTLAYIQRCLFATISFRSPFRVAKVWIIYFPKPAFHLLDNIYYHELSDSAHIQLSWSL